MNAKNQVHPPSPKKACVDSCGNNLRKLWLKDGKTTMPFTEGLTENAYEVLINTINTTLVKLGGRKIPRNKFLITR